MEMIKLEYDRILGLKHYTILAVKDKHVKDFHKSKSKYITTNDIKNFKI